MINTHAIPPPPPLPNLWEAKLKAFVNDYAILFLQGETYGLIWYNGEVDDHEVQYLNWDNGIEEEVCDTLPPSNIDTVKEIRYV